MYPRLSDPRVRMIVQEYQVAQDCLDQLQLLRKKSCLWRCVHGCLTMAFGQLD